MNIDDVIDYLLLIADDIESRYYSNNCITDLSWDELCDIGIELLIKLKE